ncbi:hypothetical protein ABZS93_04635 [Streptomyces sp900116325]|uniref:hypothetical protein n=1 Tax=Streptomyces sp. 900116325 TaxID=3154295 RepID=UPI0033BD0939
MFVQRLADGDVKGIDALADGYPDGAAAARESSDSLRPLAPAAGGGPVMAHAGPVSDSRSFPQRIEAPQGGTAEAELTLSNGKHVHIQPARERGVWGATHSLRPTDTGHGPGPDARTARASGPYACRLCRRPAARPAR